MQKGSLSLKQTQKGMESQRGTMFKMLCGHDEKASREEEKS